MYFYWLFDGAAVSKFSVKWLAHNSLSVLAGYNFLIPSFFQFGKRLELINYEAQPSGESTQLTSLAPSFFGNKTATDAGIFVC